MSEANRSAESKDPYLPKTFVPFVVISRLSTLRSPSEIHSRDSTIRTDDL